MLVLRLFAQRLLASIFFLTAQLGSVSVALTEEIIVTNHKKSVDDTRFDYPLTLLRLAMQRTELEYGPFRIERYPNHYTRKRVLRMLVSGEVNVIVNPTRSKWEETVIPIRIPIRKGLLGYRILLIRHEDEAKFKQVRNVDDLRKFRLGSGLQWSTSSALKKLGFKIHGTTEYEPLFDMLMRNRFDYFPRGVNEVFREYDRRKERYPNMIIESTLALYQPLPTYFFVTPKRPDLAKRLTKGLSSLIEDKTLDRVFYKFHGESLVRANLNKRRIIRLENPNLSKDTPFGQKKYWLRLFDD